MKYHNVLNVVLGYVVNPRQQICDKVEQSKLFDFPSDLQWHILKFLTPLCISTFYGHDGPVNSVCFSSDEDKIFSGSSNTVTVWDIITGTGERTLNTEGDYGACVSVCDSKDGKQIVSGSFYNRIKMFDITTGECTRNTEGGYGDLASVCVSDDMTLIVYGTYRNSIKVLDINTGERVMTLTDHSTHSTITSWVYAPS